MIYILLGAAIVYLLGGALILQLMQRINLPRNEKIIVVSVYSILIVLAGASLGAFTLA